jgi:hypothetical protein
MNALRKAYIVLFAIALLVLLLLRPPMTVVGWIAVGTTLVSLGAMGAWATGVKAAAGRFWLGWLAAQVVIEGIAFSRETDSIWLTGGGAPAAAAVLVSGVVLLPLYMALYRLGRGRFPRGTT